MSKMNMGINQNNPGQVLLIWHYVFNELQGMLNSKTLTFPTHIQAKHYILEAALLPQNAPTLRSWNLCHQIATEQVIPGWPVWFTTPLGIWPARRATCMRVVNRQPWLQPEKLVVTAVPLRAWYAKQRSNIQTVTYAYAQTCMGTPPAMHKAHVGVCMPWRWMLNHPNR